MKFLLTILLAVCITACGGSGDTAPPMATKLPVALVNAHDHVIPGNNHAFTITPTETLDIVASVKEQVQAEGNLVVWAGFTKGIGFSNFNATVDEAIRQSDRFKYTYIIDEMFWDFTDFKFDYDESDVLAAADYSHSRGLKTIVTLMPDVILDPRFKPRDLSKFDIITIDVYPSIRVTNELYGCKYNENLTTNLLYCSTKKLRDMGYSGEVWYVYQAFTMKTLPKEEMQRQLEGQRETILDAKNLGMAGLVPWGLYLGPEVFAAEPYLTEGSGNEFEYLLTPP